MGDVPLTRPSLLLRIQGGDHEVWREFVALYGPLVYQYARSRRLQVADAADVVRRQRVHPGLGATFRSTAENTSSPRLSDEKT